MNVLIIDDEQLILDNVYRQVAGFGLEIDGIRTAQSARAARRILDEAYMDIILCDIVMPEEDGISFAKWVLRRNPDSVFIFLTSHSDFEYMKEAISMKSFDYVLQPASEDELKDVLSRAIKQVKLQEENRRLLEDARFLKTHDENILETMGARYLFGNETNAEYFERYLKQVLGQISQDSFVFPFYLRILRGGQSLENENHLMRQMIYKNIIDEIMSPLSLVSAVFLNPDSPGDALVLLAGEKYERGSLDSTMKALETTRILYEKLLDTETVIYTAGYCGFPETREVVSAIMNEMDSIIRDISSVYLMNSDNRGNRQDFLSVKVNSWQALLNQDKIRDMKESLMTYLEEYAESGPVSRDFLVKLHQIVTELILKKIVESGTGTDEVFNKQVSYYDFMYCTKSLETFRTVINGVLDRLSTQLERNLRDPIEETIRYIHNNIDRDISVNELAERVGLSTEYFSRLFRRTTGMNLKKYIVNEKMAAAKTLLETTNLSVTTIAGHVGYNNYSNFTYSFRLLHGETPTEYRMKHRDREPS